MGTQLSGPQEKQLHDALLDAFPSEVELAQMVRFGGVARNLAVIAGSGRLGDVVFNLLVWAAARNKVDDLLLAARNANPTNVLLRSFAETVGLAAQAPLPRRPRSARYGLCPLPAGGTVAGNDEPTRVGCLSR